MPFQAIASYLGAQEQASATEYAANQSAAAQRESARLAAEAARFRPVGITTRYGSSNFQFDPQGYLKGAGFPSSTIFNFGPTSYTLYWTYTHN